MERPAATRVSAYALVTDKGRVLLCRISARVPTAAGMWTLPGGGTEFGEDPADAAVREVREETGFEVTLGGLAFVDSVAADGVHAVRIVYEARITGGALTSEADGSTDRCEFLTLEDASRLPLVPLAERGVAACSHLLAVRPAGLPAMEAFFDLQGRLTAWPAKRRKQARSEVLAWLACLFDPGNEYSEPEVNARLSEVHTFGDVAFLRRELVDAGLLRRDRFGQAYRRA